MAVRITCPSCDSSFRILDDKLGKTLRCSHCDSKFKATDSDSGGRGRKKTFELPASPKTLIAIAAVLSVALLLFIARTRLAAMLQRPTPAAPIASAPPIPVVQKIPDPKPVAPPDGWAPAPASIKAVFGDKERTCTIEIKEAVTSKDGKNSGEENASGALLEVPIAKGADPQLRVASGVLQMQGNSGTRRYAFSTASLVKLQGYGPVYRLDPSAILIGRTDAQFPVDAPAELRDLHRRSSYAYEAASLSLPQRQMAAGETWSSKHRLWAPPALLGKVVEFDLTCTYRGQKAENGRRLASVTFEGRVVAERNGIGDAKGKGVFDLDGGYFSSVELTVSTALKLEDASEQRNVANIKLQRSDGNPQSITPRMVEPVVLNAEGIVGPLDPPFLKRPPFRHKLQAVNLRGDKAYAITIESVVTPATPAFRPYLALLNPQGLVAFENYRDFEVGEAKVNFEPTQTGTFAVVVGTRSNFAGAFRILIRETERSKSD